MIPRSTSATCPPQGKALEFSIEIGVLPKAELGDYRGLEVAAARAPRVTASRSSRRSTRCASGSPGCETVERPAQSGDFVVIDYVGSLPDPRRPRGRGALDAIRRAARAATSSSSSAAGT